MSASLGTWLRTVRHLHPLQLAARVPHRVFAQLVGVVGIPTIAPPRPFEHRLAPEHVEALGSFAADESRRYEARRAWLAGSPRLDEFEARYALDLPARVSTDAWTDKISSSPYVASVRARRIASAIARGRVELLSHLVRAARAVAVAPELHLLGNHLLENGIALVSASAVTRGSEADVWWAMGSAILNWQLPVQFLRDGMHDEGSMTYHLWLVAGLIESVSLAVAARRAVPDEWTALIERAVGVVVDYEAPDGTYPLFNDAAYGAAPSIAGVRELARGCGFTVRAATRERAFSSDVGWAVLRNARAWCVVKAGPDGSQTQPGHVHADLLAIELWIDGKKAISDPGVTSYNDDAARHWCRSNAAHNGPYLEGENTPEVWGAFRTGRRCSAQLIALGDGHATAERPCAAGTLRRTRRLDASGLEVHDELISNRSTAVHWHAPLHELFSEHPARGRTWATEGGARCARISFPLENRS